MKRKLCKYHPWNFSTYDCVQRCLSLEEGIVIKTSYSAYIFIQQQWTALRVREKEKGTFTDHLVIFSYVSRGLCCSVAGSQVWVKHRSLRAPH